MPPARSKAKSGSSSSSLMNEILAFPGLVKSSPKRWIDTAPPDLRQELEAIKARFCAGTLLVGDAPATKEGLSRAISKMLALRGIIVGVQGVKRCLDAA